ncbi:MAG TPA: dihydropteroate synthase [Dehalococcoidales bacterium]|nr:dihydropteroate synthase [Dehalococcoidales bacterium]
MHTIVSSATREVVIGDDQPTVLIGERINPTGRKKLEAALEAGDMELLRREAVAQVEAGADILDVNVGSSGVDEVGLLAQVVQAVAETVDVPLSLDSDNPGALEAALKVYRGKPIINSVTGQERSLAEVLPLVKGHGAAVIALTMDDEGIPADPARRVAIAQKIIERAESLGIPREDVIIDCLVLTVATESDAALVTLEAVRQVREELGVNQTLGASNVSYGLPERNVLNSAFLAMAINAGVTCPTVNAARVRQAVLATDLLLGRDRYARRYIKDYRQRR